MVLGAAIGLASCATAPEPFEYHPDTEVKPGRGVFTGEEGTLTIYRVEEPAEAESAPAGEKTDGSAQRTEEDPAAATDSGSQ
jgi:hypothetical protein